MTRTELLALERAQILPANRALFDHVNAMEAVSEAGGLMTSALSDLANSLQSTVDDFAGVMETLAKFRTELSLDKSQLSPQEAYKAARAELDKNQVLVRSGDKAAMEGFPELASKFLAASESYFASSSGYFTDLGTVKGMLTTTETAAREAKESATAQLTDAQKQLVELGEIKSGVQALSLAMAQFTNSVTSAISVDLVSQMRYIDTNGDSTISLKEMLAKFSGVASEATLSEVFSTIDSNADSQISLLEAIRSNTGELGNVFRSVSGDLVSQMRYIDTNGDSTISLKEMLAKFAGVAGESTLKQVFAAIDEDGNGQITLLESIKAAADKTADNTYGLDRIGRVKSVVDSLNWGTAEWDASSTKTMSAIATQQGWTAQDISDAIGGHLSASDLVKFFSSYGQTLAPGFASGASSSSTGSSGGFVIGGGGTALKPPVMELVSRYDYTEGPVKDASIASLAGALKQYGYTIQMLADATGYTYSDWLENFTSRGIAAFASGGFHAGGMRLVGENGPELEVTGASRIYSAQQTRDLLSNYSGQSDNSELVAELRALRAEVAELKQHAAANVRVAQAVGKAQIETLEVIADASTDSAKSQRLMELAR